MPRILLIENDSAFSATLSRELVTRGYEVVAAALGKEGLTLASSASPQGIVLSVELPDMSGYLVCQRLRKDDALRSLPLVLTSSDASEKSFADHRKLKVRADEYLLKPFDPKELLAILARLVGVPSRPPVLETLKEAEQVSDLAAPEPEFDLSNLVNEVSEGDPSPGKTDNLAGPLDEQKEAVPEFTFDTKSEEPEPEKPSEAPSSIRDDREPTKIEADRPMAADELEEAAASLPDESEDLFLGLTSFAEDESEDADSLFGDALSSAPETSPATADSPHEATTISPVVSKGPAEETPSATPVPLFEGDLLDGDGPTLALGPLSPLFGGPAPARTEPSLALGQEASALGSEESVAGSVETQAEEADQRKRELDSAKGSLSRAESELKAKDAELKAAREKIAATTRRAEGAEAEVRASREKASEVAELMERFSAAERRAEEAARARAEAERRAAEAERRAGEAIERENSAAGLAKDKAEALATLDERTTALKTDLEKAEADKASLSARLASLVSELATLKAESGEKGAEATEKRLAEIEAANAKNEERVLKAYQKIRADEKVRDKVRKALAIATQLLEEGMAPEPASPDRPRPATPPRDPHT